MLFVYDVSVRDVYCFSPRKRLTDCWCYETEWCYKTEWFYEIEWCYLFFWCQQNIFFSRLGFISILTEPFHIPLMLGVHWRVALESIFRKWILFWVLLSESITQFSESRRVATWSQIDTILYCSWRVALRIRNGFEILKVLWCEQNNE